MNRNILSVKLINGFQLPSLVVTQDAEYGYIYWRKRGLNMMECTMQPFDSWELFDPPPIPAGGDAALELEKDVADLARRLLFDFEL